MPSEIYLVKVGMTMTEGIVDEWYVADGERVEKDDPLYRLETEKVNMDVEAEATGIVKHLVEAGKTLEPGDVVGWLYDLEESIPEVLPTPKANPNIAAQGEEAITKQPAASSPTATSAVKTGQVRVKASPAAKRLARERGVSLDGVIGSGPGGRITEKDVPEAIQPEPSKQVLASPAARRLAKELGIDVVTVPGSGPRGRITKGDVENASQKPQSVQTGDLVPMSGMRKAIAQRMFHSLQNSAQLTIDMEANMDDAIKLRSALISEWEESGVRVTYTDLVVTACVKALESHPRMNATLVDEGIQLNENTNVGIAVALDEGLIVPVIHDAHAKSLQERAGEAASLAARARAGQLGLDDVAGGTFTVTSLGMYGVDSFTPILNEPQTGILGVGRIYDSTRWVDERPERTQCLRLSLTWDHRVLDGAPAAEFLREVKELLEAPYRLVL